MDIIWMILELEPTRDEAAIQRAYARLSQTCRPEEDPAGFLRLRAAYQKALAYAREAAESGPPGGAASPYQKHEAFLKFREHYTGPQRKSAKTWMDYFTSAPFLEAARNPDFTSLLLEEVEAHEKDCPPSREFFTWLRIAYQFAIEEDQEGRRYRLMRGAEFDGIRTVLRIAEKGPGPRLLPPNELAVFISFFEYNRLQFLAENSGWEEQALDEAAHIISRYTTGYLYDKCAKQEWNDVERHPAGLRLLEQFFRRRDLPEELYRALWTRLDLKSAVFGRSKVLYSGLRELVMERVPGVENEEAENFLLLNKAHDDYLLRVRQHPEQEEQESEAFFAREDFQKALRSRRFAEEQLLRCGFWLSSTRGEGFLRRLLAFYRENPQLPCAERVEKRVEQIFRELEVQRWNAEDRNAPVLAGRPDVSYRPFFRHWLNTGFYASQGPLPGYLEQNLPYLPEWSGRFLAGPDGSPVPQTFSTVIDGKTVEITFHLRHIAYRIGGEPVYMPCLPWELLVEEGGAFFFHLLPIAAAFCDQKEAVEAELLRRLHASAPPETDLVLLAGCLAEQVCRLPVPENPEDDPLAIFPLEIFAEDGGRLYGASWSEQEGVLLLFEQTLSERRVLPRGEYEQIFDEGTALSLARRLLAEAVSPSRFDLTLLAELPWAVYVQPHRDSERTYSRKLDGPKEGEELTQEVLAELIGQFAEKKLQHLELHWSQGDLVFRSDRAGYACFYFENGPDNCGWYSMLALPEVYRTVEHDQVEYVRFGLGKLPSYSVHRDPASILRNLDLVFAQMGRGRPETRVGDRWLWSSHVELHDAKHKLLMARQKLGGIPPCRGRNYILAKFLLSQYPVQLESLTTDGQQTLTDIKSGSYGLASSALVQFVQKKLTRLRLTWAFQTPNGGTDLRHIVLLMDGGRFMMAWLRDGKRRAEFYVADPAVYMGVEGRKYPKDTFLGRTVPAYLVHQDLDRIRNCLDLMLDDIADCAPVVNQFAEFAAESPANPRPYEEIRRELVQEDGDGGAEPQRPL